MALSFLASALLKMLAPDRAATAAEFMGVPRSLARQAVIGLSILELVLGIALFLARGRLAVGAAAAVVALLSASLIRLRRRAPALSCGCFGQLGTGDQLGGLVRNVLLLALLGLAALWPGSPGLWSTAAALEIALLIAVGTEGVPIVQRIMQRRQAVAEA